MKKPFVIAHRGFSGLYPENTLIAFQKALDLKVDGMECDIHFTADNQMVVMHDPELERTTNGAGLISKTTLEEIRKLDAGSWKSPEFKGEKVPTFDEFLALAKGTGVFLCIELKAYGMAIPAIEKIREYGMEDQVILFSFYNDNVRVAKQYAPEITTLQLRWFDVNKPETLNRKELINSLLSSYANWLGINFQVMNAEFARELSQRGILTACWTVDEEAEMKRLIEVGVDAIITNYPDILQPLVR